MVKIDSEYDLEEGIPEEIMDRIEGSTELENITELGEELMNKYNLSEKLAAQYLIDSIKINFSD